ncbi:MAG TPA: TetR family transcriptional regulator [Candidatus Stackebrandtia excrementipullorum]|nr:TetR family transcriptional regulator [Candidatus Stackebrandtia excrementipullorum]
MVKNPQRRTKLLDAAIDVLADHGARGLTFRAVDNRAEVPTGTASNYFTNRDDLLRQAAEYVFVRLTTEPDGGHTVTETGPGNENALMREMVRLAEADRNGYLAMYELRLEAGRRPELRHAFTRQFRRNLDRIGDTYEKGGHPGGRATAVLLYLAMSGLVLEHLTLPDVLNVDDRLITTLVNAIVPQRGTVTGLTSPPDDRHAEPH